MGSWMSIDTGVSKAVPVQRVMMVSLGCPKNLVDSESMCRILADAGLTLVDQPQEAEAIIVNTCGFIESAKREAIDKILEMAEYKKPPYACKYLVVAGCLSQRYPEEIRRDMPEVDAILGTAYYGDIAQVLHSLDEGRERILRCGDPGSLAYLKKDRLVSTRGYAYLKIAEGCANRCSYCAIPDIRGPFTSRPVQDILDEAAILAGQGIREIILIAQDTTRYGTDLTSTETPVTLAGLLEKLDRLQGIERIRLMYCYLDGVSEELVRCLAASPKIARYLDIPVQHLSNRMLSLMNRRDTAEVIRDKIRILRERGFLESSCDPPSWSGFPGRPRRTSRLLIEGLAEIRFDRLGCFVFSPEEGTPGGLDASPRTPGRRGAQAGAGDGPAAGDLAAVQLWTGSVRR